MRLADVLTAEAQAQPAPSAPLQWIAAQLHAATHRRLSREDLTRIDHYQGGATDLHELLAAVLPLERARWYEAPVTAQHGTEMVMGYLAAPASDGIDVAWCCHVAEQQRIIGPLGPVHVTSTGMQRPPDMTDASWREIRSATGLILRALLLEL